MNASVSTFYDVKLASLLKPLVNLRLTLTVQIFLALVLGLVVGLAAPELAVQFKPLSAIFLRLIKMLIVPLLFATLVVGIAGVKDHKSIGRLGFKTILYFELATTLALGIGLFFANWLEPGKGLSLVAAPTAKATAELAAIQSNAATLAHHSFWDVIVHMIPESGIGAMAEGNILQLVIFSVFFALALLAAAEKGAPILKALESLSEVMFKMVGHVMKVAPFGVFGAMAASIGQNGVGVLLVYAKLVGSLYLALAVFVLLVLGLACWAIRVPFMKMLSAIKEPALLAFSTASSESALPKAMSVMERFGVPKHVVAFVMPTGYSFNLDGSTLYLSLATLFVAQLAGIQLPLSQQIMILLTLMLTSKGVAAIPRTSLVILAGTLAAFNLPVEGIAIILGIDHVLDMGRTAVNLTGNCVATAVIARWEGVFDDSKMLAFGMHRENTQALALDSMADEEALEHSHTRSRPALGAYASS
ncbi:MAG: cation:dicarboxylase symporter family transporter [Vampirovibrionales bacterium]|nr:cation:dicarboxylase symporter family transporter [Vampirovibrionales bacterium]